MNPAQKALWYIESHLAAPLTLDEISAVAGVSRFHLVRAFAAATSYWISIAAVLPGRWSYAGTLGTGGLGCSRQIGPCCQSTPLDRRRTPRRAQDG
jgi:hypothetical protein